MNNLFFRNINKSEKCYLEEYYRGYLPPKENKYNISKIKCNTCKSLYEVEYFLNNLQKFVYCIKLHKILK